MSEDLKALRIAKDDEGIINSLKSIERKLDDHMLRDQYVNEGLVEILRDLVVPNNLVICSKALSLITRIVEENEEFSQKLVQPFGFLKQLITFCWPLQENSHDIKNYDDHMTICVQAVALVRKLVCNNKFLVCAANIDLVQNVIDLCRLHFDESDQCCYGNQSYPTTATLLLQSLVHGKNLIGKVRELSSKISEDILDSTLGQDVITQCANGCVLSIDLYDTTTDKDIIIRKELIKEKMAWPRFLTPDYEKDDSKDNGEWADVTVTSVVNGGHFWAHVGGKDIEEKLHSIRAVLENENVDCKRLTSIPMVGELVTCHSMLQGYVDIYRGKVLQIITTQDEITLEVFAVDYGFKKIVSLNCVSEITDLGRKEQFQARFCCLHDVQPPYEDVDVLINLIGTLRNLAKQANACRLPVMNKNGIEVLLKFLVLPYNELQRQVIGTLLNMSLNFKTRERIGYFGGVKILTDLIRNDFRKDPALLYLAICALRNLMFKSPTNRGQCADEDGLFALTDVYISTPWDKIQQQCLGALKILIGNSWYMLIGNDGMDLRSVIDVNQDKSFSLSAAITTKFPSVYRRRKHLRPGEVEPQPIEKALPSHVIKTLSNQESDESISDHSDGEEPLFNISPSNDTLKKSSEEDIHRYYIEGQAVPFTEDDTHEFRFCKDVNRLLSSIVARSACAFLNAGKGGTIYLGAKKTGEVCGVRMSRRDRDRLRCGIDEILGEFKPSVRYDKYKIDFFPVVREVMDNSLCGKSVELIPDVYIIEISFAESTGTVYTTSRNKCIFRCGDSNCEYSIQDLRKLVIRQQETFYNDQIKILKRELSAIRQLNDR